MIRANKQRDYREFRCRSLPAPVLAHTVPGGHKTTVYFPNKPFWCLQKHISLFNHVLLPNICITNATQYNEWRRRKWEIENGFLGGTQMLLPYNLLSVILLSFLLSFTVQSVHDELFPRSVRFPYFIFVAPDSMKKQTHTQHTHLAPGRPPLASSSSSSNSRMTALTHFCFTMYKSLQKCNFFKCFPLPSEQ